MIKSIPTQPDLIPSWESLFTGYVASGVPGLSVIRQDPRVAIFIDAGGLRFGALFAVGCGTRPLQSPLTEISVSQVLIDGERYIEVATGSRSLYRDFYLLIGEVINTIVKDNAPPVVALEDALSRWQSLLRRCLLLSEEAQLGLFGELWMLNRLAASQSFAALDAWVGPGGETHDFRLGEVEFEVKTTSSQSACHFINGVSQLVPSTGCCLYVLSLHLIDAGASGRTLGEIVEDVRTHFRGRETHEIRFNTLLEQVGYRPGDAEHYQSRRRLGRSPRLVPVTEGCPRLTREALSLLPPHFEQSRILNVEYSVNLDGLGFADGEPRFMSVLP